MVGYPFGTPSSLENGTGFTVGSFPQLIEWERTNQSNFGIDFGILGKLSGSFDLFRRLTEGMHMAVKAPAHVGFRYDVTANAATVRNQGVELSLDYRDKIGSFNYTVGGNVSLLKTNLQL